MIRQSPSDRSCTCEVILRGFKTYKDQARFTHSDYDYSDDTAYYRLLVLMLTVFFLGFYGLGPGFRVLGVKV